MRVVAHITPGPARLAGRSVFQQGEPIEAVVAALTSAFVGALTEDHAR